jgi:hypothetical protein
VQGAHDRSGQRRDIDDDRRIVMPDGIGDRVGDNNPALGMVLSCVDGSVSARAEVE